MKMILAALISLSAFSASASAVKCDLKKVLETAIMKNLNSNVRFGEITKISKNEKSYSVIFTYVGEDFMDEGFMSFVVDARTCKAKPAR